MKVLSKLMIVFLALTLIVSCKNTPEGTKAKVGDAATELAKATAAAKNFAVSDGTIHWTSTKVGGQHSGTIKVKEGKLATEGGNLTSGKFAIDMASIDVTDGTEGEMKTKLLGHLASGDFFDVANNPMGSFAIVSVAATPGNEASTHNITGNLTLKGITKSVTIPANVIIAGDQLSAVTPKFTINRTEWDVKYGSGLIGTAADKIIHDEISLVINLEGKAG